MVKKSQVTTLEKGVGFVQGFVTNLMDVIREHEFSFDVIHRLVTPQGRATVEKMVLLAHADWLALQPKPIEEPPQGCHSYRDAPTNGNILPPNHYRVSLTYAPIPSIDELNREWGYGNVSDIFDGRLFELHASCVNLDRTPGEKTFYVHDAGGNWKSEEQIAWGDLQRNAAAPNGYRPAIHEEIYEFAKAYSKLVDFVGLGSYTMHDGRRHAASVWRHGSRRILGHRFFVHLRGRRPQILFVAKTTKE